MKGMEAMKCADVGARLRRAWSDGARGRMNTRITSFVCSFVGAHHQTAAAGGLHVSASTLFMSFMVERS
jgi:hypothetical protein